MPTDQTGTEADLSAHSPDVALFMPTFIGGGAERIQLVLAEYFLTQGLRVDVVACKNVGPLREKVPAGARLVSLDANRVLLSLGRYLRYLRSARPRAVISSVENAGVVACLARALGAPPHRLIVRQDNALLSESAWWREPRRWAWLLVLAVVFRFADQVIAVSRAVESELRQLLRQSKTPIHCVYNPIITSDYGSRLDAEPELPWLDRGAPLIVSAGRLHELKDYPTLLRAFASLRRRTAARLLIMGEGDARPSLEALATELGIAADVSFPGFVKNPLPMIRRADVFVLSSRLEGLPTVLVEALAAGSPIVSTDCRHGPRELLRDGRYGRLVPVGDPEALADAITETLASPKSPPRHEVEELLEQFTVERVGRRYASMLTSSLAAVRGTELFNAPKLRRP